MKEINFTELLKRQGKPELAHGYELEESEKYFVKYTEDFFRYNVNTCFTIEIFGGVSNPDCFRVVKDFNNFMNTFKNKSFKEQQKFFKNMWGKQFLWNNKYTRGIVVKLVEPDNINDFTYQVLVECSRECTGFKYTKFIPSDAYTQEGVKEVFKYGTIN